MWCHRLMLPVFGVLLVNLAFNALPVFAVSNSAMQGLHQDTLDDIEAISPQYLAPVEILWRSSLQRNPTLQLALQKLAEKSGNWTAKEKKKWTQGLLQTVIRIGGMGGAVATGSAAPIIGSAVIGRISAPDTAPKRLTAVTSADMVILAREVEEAQSQLLWQYVRYRHAQVERDALRAHVAALQNQIAQLSVEDPTMAPLLNSLVTQDLMRQQQVETEVATSRQLLVLAAGEAAVAEADKMTDNDAKLVKPMDVHD